MLIFQSADDDAIDLGATLKQTGAERDAAIALLGKQALAMHQLNDGLHPASLSVSVCDQRRLHRVFCQCCAPWRGVAREASEFAVDFHGIFTRLSFFPSHLSAGAAAVAPGDLVSASLPDPTSANTFVHASLLMAIAGSDANEGGAVVVGDLGAGWGHWLTTAHHAARRHFRNDSVRVQLIGVEAEPTHFEFLLQHMLDNGVDARQHTLLNRVVHAGSEFVQRLSFYVGRADEWYGQCIANDGRRGEQTASLPTVTVNEVLRNVTRGIDWLQIDIGGYHGAFELVRGGIDELRRRVRWLVVRTVDPTEHAAVREVLRDWWMLTDYVGRSEPHTTPWGKVTFENGLLVLLNPQRVAPHQFMH